jgi:hypothetical protein
MREDAMIDLERLRQQIERGRNAQRAFLEGTRQAWL